ncbi:glycosyltransferase [Legionella sp. 16cNR16C]|uniref:glycosyltransferase n=1 Tax=Legionella sp. 16cNR16C TaxID=2905656 RepID=UPI001E58E260|nr:glycosyltransferase [Legionella sp. 16cNR16C]MCE3046336.1 glycosyltransferase [Legionella sp. 16cNR16C]
MQINCVTSQHQPESHKPVRVMWLIHDADAKKFEIAMLKTLGIHEIYLPKISPVSCTHIPDAIDYSEDAGLSIPEEKISLLNHTDWYSTPDDEAIAIANDYFDIAFIHWGGAGISRFVNQFKGTLILRAYGIPNELAYSSIINLHLLNSCSNPRLVRSLGSRFWFGEAFENIKANEPEYIKKRAIYLPVGLTEPAMAESWEGSDKSIFFVCPDLARNSYNKKTQEKFSKDFAGFPYVIAGEQQFMPKNANNILRFQPKAEHKVNLREMRVMFYYNEEQRYLHKYPLEAIQSGMPLIFMAGGVLDQLGGSYLPGRCLNISEAQEKIKRILNDDWDFINEIRKTQLSILEQISWKHCESAWRNSFTQVLKELSKPQQQRPAFTLAPRKKIAVILPIGYRGGTLKAAKLITQALYQGSREWQEPAEVVFFHLDEPGIYSEEDWDTLFPGVQRRSYQWKILSSPEARRAMRYAGYDDWEPTSRSYCVPDDGINDSLDCDLWIVVSDRMNLPLLPIRPNLYIIYDCIQRYIPAILPSDDIGCIEAVRQANGVLVTTQFTKEDVHQYFGIEPQKVKQVPMLMDFFKIEESWSIPEQPYFLWTTNKALHKNLENALTALYIYYTRLDGKFACHVTGVNAQDILETVSTQTRQNISALKNSQEKIIFWGELSELEYQNKLAGAKFLWHPCRIDNGTGSVVEAASLNVPSLSSDYPAMREMNETFSLNLTWMNPDNPGLMAAGLKEMENNYQPMKKLLPADAKLAERQVEKLASEYWRVVRECL